MGIISKEVVELGLKLELARRSGPRDDKGHPLGFELAHKEYSEFIMRHGWLLLSELKQRIDKENV
jgi:hypothetical protein